tara:strand:+ start:435 stop:1121 length:687 start_codon:yes stop_codon:yes gene_type:complete
VAHLQSQYEKEKASYIKDKKQENLRQRQKRFARDEIIDAALKLFQDRGYKHTTMQVIADEAGVGIATVFRLFGKKNAILAACIKNDLEDIFTRGWQCVLSPKNSPDETLCELLDVFLSILSKPSKNIDVPYQHWPSVVTGEPEIDATVKWADETAKLLIYGVMFEHNQHQKLKATFDIADMATNIFYIFNGHYINYLTDTNYALSELTGDIKRRVSLVVTPLINNQGS